MTAATLSGGATGAAPSPLRTRSTSSRKGLGKISRNPANENARPLGGTRGGGGTNNITESRKHEAFESGNPRDAYSSVSHLKGNLDSLSFAIGLREGEGQEGALERLLPMLKIQPRPAGDANRRGDKTREKGYLECEHPDCIVREEKIKKLQELIEEEQEGLERLTFEIDSLNERHTRATAEMETLDDQIDVSMARRVEIDAQNAELQLVVDEADSRKRQLQEQVDAVKNEVEDLSTRLETRDKERKQQELHREMLDSAHMVFRRESPEEAASEEVRSVRDLPALLDPAKTEAASML
ncbi:unnamed protein product [Ectocarpus sp. 12 AP-2014]